MVPDDDFRGLCAVGSCAVVRSVLQFGFGRRTFDVSSVLQSVGLLLLSTFTILHPASCVQNHDLCDVIVACELRVVWLRSWLLHHPTLQRVQIPWASCAHILNEERKYVSSLNRKLCDTFVLVFCCQQPRFVGIVTFWSNQLVRTS